MYRIAIDVMGGDNGPAAMISGALESLEKVGGTRLALFGPAEQIREELKKQNAAENDRLLLVDAPDVISLHESPTVAIRRKKESSLVRALRSVKEGENDAVISAGSSGAILAGGTLIVGRQKGVLRPPLGALIPTKRGLALLVDCGANVDAKPEWLLQYGIMGAAYMKDMIGIDLPKVGLVNIGAEEEKGNALVKEAMPLFRNLPEIDFIGSCEARDIPDAPCDVIVADAFVGNVVLKMYEGTAKMLLSEILGALKSSPAALLGAALAKGALRKTLKRFDAKQYGGAPILGLNGLVVKVHGNTDGREVAYAVRQCADFIEKDIVGETGRRLLKWQEYCEAQKGDKENGDI